VALKPFAIPLSNL